MIDNKKSLKSCIHSQKLWICAVCTGYDFDLRSILCPLHLPDYTLYPASQRAIVPTTESPYPKGNPKNLNFSDIPERIGVRE